MFCGELLRMSDLPQNNGLISSDLLMAVGLPTLGLNGSSPLLAESMGTTCAICACKFFFS